MLNSAQLATLRAEILASSDPAVVAARAIRNDSGLAEIYNANTTTIVWKSSVTAAAVGEAMRSSEVAGLTTANTNRLMVMVQYSGGAFSPSRADTRAGFDDVFSGAGGVQTRTALLALWKRPARRIEALFCGVGTDAVPAILVVEGVLSAGQIGDAMNNNF